MDINYIEIGRRIKENREKSMISQARLAEKVNISNQHMCHIENGKTKLSLPVLLKISNALKITIDPLITESLFNSSELYKEEFNDLLSDCSICERRIILEISKTLKKELRKENKR